MGMVKSSGTGSPDLWTTELNFSKCHDRAAGLVMSTDFTRIKKMWKTCERWPNIELLDSCLVFDGHRFAKIC